MIQYLSYKLSPLIPVYGSTMEKLELREVRSIASGDPCQTYWIGMENHWGTHVDCPAHFFTQGSKVTDYSCDFWFFRKPQVVKIDAEPGKIITQKDLLDDIYSETDLILFQSGWSKFREKDIYSFHNPGLDPELGLWLRQKYLSLRAIGIDWVSISSFQHKELGREAHRALLNSRGEGNPIVVIEDMNLSGNLYNLKEVWVSPLLVEMIDSAPCTVVGFFK
ncbi:MAG: cyclase family protein [Deltaproteobacteria bacterium]|nr:cyclase family protein [Deltaproteobacteria bacterium]